MEGGAGSRESDKPLPPRSVAVDELDEEMREGPRPAASTSAGAIGSLEPKNTEDVGGG